MPSPTPLPGVTAWSPNSTSTMPSVPSPCRHASPGHMTLTATPPGPGGNFLEDRKAITFGLGASYQSTWSADLSYTDFFGAGRYNLVNDRDFVAFNIKYSF